MTIYRDTSPQFNRASASRRHLHRCRIITAREWIEPAYRRPLPPARPSARLAFTVMLAGVALGGLLASLLWG